MRWLTLGKKNATAAWLAGLRSRDRLRQMIAIEPDPGRLRRLPRR